MALFNKKPSTKEKVEKKTAKAEKTIKVAKVAKAEGTEVAVVAKEAKKVSAPAKVGRTGGLEQNMVLLRPHITEKATNLSEKNVYAFEIAFRANKMQVKDAIHKFYKVKPVKVAIIMGTPKLMKNPRTGRMQVKKTAIKKALVYLKKGDKIEFV